jgi:hypothetical protein
MRAGDDGRTVGGRKGYLIEKKTVEEKEKQGCAVSRASGDGCRASLNAASVWREKREGEELEEYTSVLRCLAWARDDDGRDAHWSC